MFTGFNLTINNDDFLDDHYYSFGLETYNKLKTVVFDNLTHIFKKDIIDGDLLQNMWFPTEIFGEKNFIFISHSHNDEKLAISLAGYLHTKFNILSFIDSCVWDHMDELNKIQKVINKEMPEASKEVLLVIDAGTGQNAISQVKAFKEQADITGIILTKLDGTAKGGAVIGIVEENKIPIKFIGVGEQIDDMERSSNGKKAIKNKQQIKNNICNSIYCNICIHYIYFS